MQLNLKDVGTLRTLYDASVNCDKALFSEMRTNVMLRNGDHYNKGTNKVLEEFRRKGVISKDEKIRLTKNHSHRITNEYINSVLSRGPATTAAPFNDGDLQDIKNAEMANSVMDWIKSKNNWNTSREDFVHEQMVVGETYAFVKFDPSFGSVIGEEAREVVNPETGMVDVEREPVMEGRVEIEKRFGFDVKRDPSAKSFEDSRYFFLDKLVDFSEAKAIVKRYLGEDKVESLKPFVGGEGTVTVFDYNTASYIKQNHKVLFREMLIRPCNDYPNGKYVLFTDSVVVVEVDLPLGLFPLFQLGFDRITTTPRCSSILRVARPFQVEINRASSKIVEHQITLGDDKVYTSQGQGIVSSKNHSGIREFKVNGGAPVIVPGRTGDQYVSYVSGEVAGMYQACGVDYLMVDKPKGGDPYALLHQSITQKAVFVPYVSKFEEFEKQVMTAALKLARAYLTPHHMIRIVGKKETVNIDAFKNLEDSSYDVKVEATSEDVETKFGRILTTTSILQYAGSNMSPEQVGQLTKNLPYGNKKEVFNTLTLNYDTAVNIILSLDRGVAPYVPQYANLDYILSAITNRMVQADFPYTSPEVQQLYAQLVQGIEQAKAQQAVQAQQASMGAIPADGFLVTCQASVEKPTGQGGTKTERIKVPSSALAWLVEKLSQQGFYAQQMQNLPPQVQAEIAAMGQQQQGAQPQVVPQY